jgi:hypothetical protein
MEVQAAELNIHYISADLDPLRLIVQLVPFFEGVGHWNASETGGRLEILRQLRHNIGHQLMKLSMELQ